MKRRITLFLMVLTAALVLFAVTCAGAYAEDNVIKVKAAITGVEDGFADVEYTVTNTSDVTVTINWQVAVDEDNLIGARFYDDLPVVLAPGESNHCRYSEQIQDVDTKRGYIGLDILASGFDENGNDVVETCLCHWELYELRLSVSVISCDEKGTLLGYEITNVSDKAIKPETVAALNYTEGNSADITEITLEPGEVCSGELSYTGYDTANSCISEMFTASGKDADGNPVQSNVAGLDCDLSGSILSLRLIGSVEEEDRPEGMADNEILFHYNVQNVSDGFITLTKRHIIIDGVEEAYAFTNDYGFLKSLYWSDGGVTVTLTEEQVERGYVDLEMWFEGEKVGSKACESNRLMIHYILPGTETEDDPAGEDDNVVYFDQLEMTAFLYRYPDNDENLGMRYTVTNQSDVSITLTYTSFVDDEINTGVRYSDNLQVLLAPGESYESRDVAFPLQIMDVERGYAHLFGIVGGIDENGRKGFNHDCDAFTYLHPLMLKLTPVNITENWVDFDFEIVNNVPGQVVLDQLIDIYREGRNNVDLGGIRLGKGESYKGSGQCINTQTYDEDYMYLSYIAYAKDAEVDDLESNIAVLYCGYDGNEVKSLLTCSADSFDPSTNELTINCSMINRTDDFILVEQARVENDGAVMTYQDGQYAMPTDSYDFTVKCTVPQSDVDRGYIKLNVYVDCNDMKGSRFSSNKYTVLYLIHGSEVDLKLTEISSPANGEYYEAGETIEYLFTMKNLMNYDIDVMDFYIHTFNSTAGRFDFSGESLQLLKPKEEMSGKFKYTVSEKDAASKIPVRTVGITRFSGELNTHWRDGETEYCDYTSDYVMSAVGEKMPGSNGPSTRDLPHENDELIVSASLVSYDADSQTMTVNFTAENPTDKAYSLIDIGTARVDTNTGYTDYEFEQGEYPIPARGTVSVQLVLPVADDEAEWGRAKIRYYMMGINDVSDTIEGEDGYTLLIFDESIEIPALKLDVTYVYFDEESKAIHVNCTLTNIGNVPVYPIRMMQYEPAYQWLSYILYFPEDGLVIEPGCEYPVSDVVIEVSEQQLADGCADFTLSVEASDESSSSILETNEASVFLSFPIPEFTAELSDYLASYNLEYYESIQQLLLHTLMTNSTPYDMTLSEDTCIVVELNGHELYREQQIFSDDQVIVRAYEECPWLNIVRMDHASLPEGLYSYSFRLEGTYRITDEDSPDYGIPTPFVSNTITIPVFYRCPMKLTISPVESDEEYRDGFYFDYTIKNISDYTVSAKELQMLNAEAFYGTIDLGDVLIPSGESISGREYCDPGFVYTYDTDCIMAVFQVNGNINVHHEAHSNEVTVQFDYNGNRRDLNVTMTGKLVGTDQVQADVLVVNNSGQVAYVNLLYISDDEYCSRIVFEAAEDEANYHELTNHMGYMQTAVIDISQREKDRGYIELFAHAEGSVMTDGHPIFSNEPVLRIMLRDCEIETSFCETSSPANGEAYEVGETIRYVYTVTNMMGYDMMVWPELCAGNMAYGTEHEYWGSALWQNGEAVGLAPGETKKYTFSYTVRDYDTEAGDTIRAYVTCYVINEIHPDYRNGNVNPGRYLTDTIVSRIVDKQADGPSTRSLRPEQYDVSVVLAESSTPANKAAYKPEEKITYTLTVTNNMEYPITHFRARLFGSNVDLSDIGDDGVDVSDEYPIAPGETITITLVKTVSTHEANAGHLVKMMALCDYGVDPFDQQSIRSNDVESEVMPNVKYYTVTCIDCTFSGGGYSGATSGRVPEGTVITVSKWFKDGRDHYWIINDSVYNSRFWWSSTISYTINRNCTFEACTWIEVN